jgi:hypothetical protein
VIYLVSEAPADYHQFVMASAGSHGVTRQMALRKMVRPFARAFRQLAELVKPLTGPIPVP